MEKKTPDIMYSFIHIVILLLSDTWLMHIHYQGDIYRLITIQLLYSAIDPPSSLVQCNKAWPQAFIHLE